MGLKLYIIKLKDKDAPLGSSTRNVEHLFVKHSGVKITLPDAINIIGSVNVGNDVEVLFNSNKIDIIEKAFSKFPVTIEEKKKA